MPAPPSANEMVVSSTTGFVLLNTVLSNTAILTPHPTMPLTTLEGRLLRIKATTPDSNQISGTAPLLCSNGTVFYPSASNATLLPYQCATFMENPANTYNIITYYQGTFSGYALPNPGTPVVNINGSNSLLFVDLRTTSKVFVLPPIPSLTSNEKQAPTFLFKDVYGSIGFNPWYISTSGGSDNFEGLGATLSFTSPNMAIELVGKLGNRDTFFSNYWYIVSGYGF